MTDNEPGLVEVTQADNDAAMEWAEIVPGNFPMELLAKAFARHRTEQLAERDATIARLRRRLTDSEYLREAYRQMLGEKGREVARVWEEKGLVRVHMSWTVDPYSLPGEEVAETLLAWEAAPRTPLTDVDVDAALAEREG